ncbi:MAG TPA: RNB domain-containing ribonuclease [Vicinamibacteria bacterium]
MTPDSAGGRERLREIARRAMRQRGFEPDFPPAVLAETRALSVADGASAEGVTDLRSLAWVSIDNDDSRDLDQLSVAEALADGSVRLLVAVADVASLVRRGSAIDERARTNTTSVYTPAQVFPMLPERLSTDLTSLNPDEDRLAVVVALTVRPDGSVAEPALSRGRVRNKARLAYDSVAAWLDGRAAPPPAVHASKEVEAQVRLQDVVAGAMRNRREERGALALSTSESRVVFDGDLLADLRPDEDNRAKEMIQDFMIAANSAAAWFLEAKGFPSIRRILRSPDRWDRIVALAREAGETLPDAPSAGALQAFLLRRRSADPLRFPDLSLSVVKLLGSGEYGVEAPGRSLDGHFGLAVKDYAHSTAPNRRYPDLVTQRLIKAALAGQECPYAVADLEALARHCTEQEDDAAKIERQVKKSAAAMLLAGRKGERFDGIVTGASSKGTWVRVFRPPVEGRVVRGEKGLDVGERVTVVLLDTDVERGFIDFARA